jgi:hypothetical protein
MHPGQPLSRFVAKAVIGKRTGTVVVLASVGGVVGVAVILPALPEPMRKVFPLCVLLLLGGYGAFVARSRRGANVTLDVSDGRLLVDEGRRGAFPIAGALLGLWRTPGIGVVSGTILHLHDGQRVYRVGGLDHRPAASLPLRAPITDEADAFLPAREFDALLELTLAPMAPVYRDVPAPTAVARCQLLPNPWLARNWLGHMVPWFGAIALVMVITGVLATSGLFETLGGQFIGIALILPIIAGGLVLTTRRSLGRQPVFVIEIDPRELRVRDLATSAITFTAPLGALTCLRGVRRYNMGRGGTFEHAVLAITRPGQEPLTIGVADARFGWIDSGATIAAPRYVVGPPDWHVLTAALGVRGAVRMTA